MAAKVIKQMLLPYISTRVIPEMNRERWRVPAAAEMEPMPREGEFVIFMSFFT
jgi:hypothetical protein